MAPLHQLLFEFAFMIYLRVIVDDGPLTFTIDHSLPQRVKNDVVIVICSA